MSKTLCLIDGSALSAASKHIHQSILMNYHRLADLLEEKLQVTSSVPVLFYTTSDQKDKKHSAFLKTLEKDLNWTVLSDSPFDAQPVNHLLSGADSRALPVRFHSQMSYALAYYSRLEYSSMIVVSDSWPLYLPIKDLIGRGLCISLAFFGSLIDARWHRRLRELTPKGLAFLDLDASIPSLFDTAHLPVESIQGLIPELP